MTDAQPFRVERILVPIDFSDNSRNALAYAKSMAERFEAEIRLLYVVPTTVVPLEAYELTPDYGTLVKWGEQNLAELCKGSFTPDARVSWEVRSGEPHAEIVDAAQVNECDLVVMSTHGHAGLRHLMLGSTTERVVRTCPVPVLTKRIPDK